MIKSEIGESLLYTVVIDYAIQHTTHSTQHTHIRIKAAYPQAPLSPRSKLSTTHSRLRLLQIEASN